MWVLVPTDEILFFARTNYMDVVNAENAGAIFRKEKYPKENPPGCRFILRFSFSTGGDRRGFLPLDHRDSSLNRP